MRIGLFFQAGNFIGPEYYALLKASGYNVTAFSWGRMKAESVAREVERTGGLWRPDEISTVSDAGCSRAFLGEQLPYLDVCVNGGIGRKLEKQYLDAPGWGWLNVHPGKLPEFRGSSCPEWAKLLGQPVVCTAHKMDEGIDTGPVVHERTYYHDLEWNYHQFRAHLYACCAITLVQAIKRIERGVVPLPQYRDGTTWPQMPPEVLEIVKRRFFPHHPRLI